MFRVFETGRKYLASDFYNKMKVLFIRGSHTKIYKWILLIPDDVEG